MAFTTEAMAAPAPAPAKANSIEQNQFDLPSKEFVGYDPKGTTSITGSPLVTSKKDVAVPPAPEHVEETPNQEEIKLSPQISAIARKEQAQRRREQALVQREKALEAKLADADKYNQLRTKIASKDYSAADELGMAYDDWTQYQIDKHASSDPTEQRHRQLEEKLSNLEKAQEEQTIKEYQHNQTLWKQEIAKVVGENEEFSTIKELGLEHLVLQHVNDSFDEDGVELTVEQAAKQIEEELVKRAEMFASVSKVKRKVEEPAKLGAPKSSPKTITNSMTVSSEKQSSKPFHLMSESEQIAEAYRRVQAAKLQR